MWVKIKQPVKGYGYFGGETVGLSDEIASEFINAGAAILVPPTEGDEGENDNTLPPDMPMRELLYKNGYESVGQILGAKDTLMDIKGIGNASAGKIIEFCENYEG